MQDPGVEQAIRRDRRYMCLRYRVCGGAVWSKINDLICDDHAGILPKPNLNWEISLRCCCQKDLPLLLRPQNEENQSHQRVHTLPFDAGRQQRKAR